MRINPFILYLNSESKSQKYVTEFSQRRYE